MSKSRVWAAGLILIGLAFTSKGLLMGGKAIMAQILLENAWTQSVKTGSPTPPWGWMDAYPIAKISVPSVGSTAIVLNNSSGQALAFGPAHMAQTPLPGQPGTSIIAAHKNTHFAFLKNVRTGDIINIELSDGTNARFEVTNAAIVHKDRSGIAVREAVDAPAQLALVTCYPFDAISYGGPMRYVVRAKLLKFKPS